MTKKQQNTFGLGNKIEKYPLAKQANIQDLLKSLTNNINSGVILVFASRSVGGVKKILDCSDSFVMDIFQYRKFFIYVLTFLAYTWSVYGSGLLGNLRDAVLAAESIFTDFIQNAIPVTHKLKDIHEVFNSNVEEHCNFECYSGAIPKANWNHKPQSNGCGSLGVKISQEYLPLEEMTKCCNIHDICYDTCNSDKDKCDLDFKRCLYKYCETYQSTSVTIINICKTTAKLLFTSTTVLGCKSYLDAQKQACYCRNNNKNKKSK